MMMDPKDYFPTKPEQRHSNTSLLIRIAIFAPLAFLAFKVLYE